MSPPRRRNEKLRALLAEARWTQAALARSVNVLAAEIDLDLNYDRTAVAHWLSGTQPLPPVPELIAEALTRRLGRSISPVAAGLAHETSVPADGRLSENGSPGEMALTHLCGMESDPARRVSARLQPYREADLAQVSADPRAWAAHAVPPARTAEGHHEGAGELTVVRLAVRFYAASFNAYGGRRARSSLATYLADDIAPRLRESGDQDLHRGFLVEASRLSFLLARMHQDASVHGLAQRHFTTALQLAAESGDATAWAVVLRGLSAQGLELGHRQIALHAAEAAAKSARAPDGATLAFLLSQLAVAQAACGLRREAVASLGRAEHAVEAGEREAARTGPFDAYSRAAFEFQSAEVLRHLGNVPAARTALHRSLTRRPDDDHRGLALSHAQYAEMLVGLGHVEEACSAWNSFLDHYVHLRSGAADLAVNRLRQLLSPFRQLPLAYAILHRTSALTSAVPRH
ncbi:tol-pal system YbgF family protein [Streptomyces sp. NPDC048650]|uniref:tetratricopeptide repeat protein n=1 Tax=unclassified Streptomyces TaxID=2593676 RepID=UPI00371B5EFE